MFRNSVNRIQFRIFNISTGLDLYETKEFAIASEN